MKQTIWILACASVLASCVTQKQFDELMTQKVKGDHANEKYQADLEQAQSDIAELEGQKKALEAEQQRLTHSLSSATAERDRLKVELEELKTIYNNLLNNSGRLNRDLEAKQQRLDNLSNELEDQRKANEALAQDLAMREQRVMELEQIIAEKESAVVALRNKVSQALLNFAENDLSIEVRNGKVYVSLSEDLLFQSGSASVDPKGVDALRKLAGVLVENPDINIMVEGHTDDVPLNRSSPYLKDNWDLSVLRATSIVRILTNAGVSPASVTASGRGEFIPLASNETAEGRAANRRTEIILSPKLDELFQLLESK